MNETDEQRVAREAAEAPPAFPLAEGDGGGVEGGAQGPADGEPEVNAPPQENTVVAGPDAGETGAEYERRLAAENAAPPEGEPEPEPEAP